MVTDLGGSLADWKKLYKLKINNVILEASSHGLKQHRLNNINFNTAVFTNFSRDHLDYHKTFSDYLNSKLILFNKLLKKKGNIIFDQKIFQAKKLKNNRGDLSSRAHKKHLRKLILNALEKI